MLGLAALSFVACKRKAKSDGPERNIRDWTLAEIEAELEHNDQALADAGIMIAMASPVTVGNEAHEFSTDKGPNDHSAVGPEAGPEVSEPELSGDDDADWPPEPTASEPPPMSEPGRAYSEDFSSERRSRKSARARRETPTRCDRVCELAVATCELETQICELAQRHPDEPRYASACARAEQQCVAASQACQRCED